MSPLLSALTALNARRRGLLAALAAAWPARGWPRQDDETTLHLRLGDTPVQLLASGAADAPVLLLNLHENERTSVQAARAVLQPTRHRLVRLQAQGRRLVVFRLNGQAHAFDPNRIFTEAGLARTLRLYGRHSPAAAAEVRGLRDPVLAEAQRPGRRLVVALHNNGAGAYAIDQYRPGARLAADAAALTEAPGADVGDFFLVTQASAYQALAASGHSVVLQSPQVRDDGSLSVRLNQAQPLYVNVEARHGHLAQQQAMLATLLQRLGPG